MRFKIITWADVSIDDDRYGLTDHPVKDTVSNEVRLWHSEQQRVRSTNITLEEFNTWEKIN
tara:strand:- start:499 stop:681 length:183 start_codon:yes stop_codon:yes gene_type:complete